VALKRLTCSITPSRRPARRQLGQPAEVITHLELEDHEDVDSVEHYTGASI